MSKLLLTITLTVITASLFGQIIPKYETLLDTVTKNSALFISAHPVKKIYLNLSDTFQYREYLQNEYNYNIDQTLLIELISNSQNPDTSKWTDNDFKNSILIENLDDYISSKKVANKFSIVDKKKLLKIKQQVLDFNEGHPFNRNIYHFSRPIFDNTKTYAVISYGSGNKGLMGRDFISLFHYSNNTWTEVRVLTRWIY